MKINNTCTFFLFFTELMFHFKLIEMSYLIFCEKKKKQKYTVTDYCHWFLFMMSGFKFKLSTSEPL